jgi:hypothetical protein
MITIEEKYYRSSDTCLYDVFWGRKGRARLFLRREEAAYLEISQLCLYAHAPGPGPEAGEAYARLVLGRLERLSLVILPQHVTPLLSPGVGELLDVFSVGGTVLCKVRRRGPTLLGKKEKDVTLYVPTDEVDPLTERAVAKLMQYR